MIPRPNSIARGKYAGVPLHDIPTDELAPTLRDRSLSLSERELVSDELRRRAFRRSALTQLRGARREKRGRK